MEEQAAYYVTTELFDHNLGYKVTLKLISGVKEFFRDIKTEEKLNYGMLPSTPKFNTYLQFIGMGIAQVPLPPSAPCGSPGPCTSANAPTSSNTCTTTSCGHQ